jgi:hypothetical protein
LQIMRTCRAALKYKESSSEVHLIGRHLSNSQLATAPPALVTKEN